MTPDRLSRRAALSMVVLVIALLITVSACTKKQPPQAVVTESAAQATATGTTATDTGATLALQSTATDTTGTGGQALVMDKATIDKMTHPVVMIDPKTFKVDQKEVHLFDFEPDPGNPHTPSPNAVRIYWRTTTGKGNLELNFLQKTCVSNEVCKTGAGECSATALPHPKPGTRCEYTLKLDDHNVDPVIIVDPCCP